MPVFAFHGKLGSGKNEGSKQMKQFIANDMHVEYTEKAFATKIKELVAKLTATSLETQHTHEGKNEAVPLFSDVTGECMLDLGALADELVHFEVFAERRRGIIVKEMRCFFWKMQTEKHKDKRNAFTLTMGELQQEIGTRFRETYDDDIWVKRLFDEWTPESKWLITDLRFPNEKRKVMECGGKCIKMVGDPKKVRENSKRDLNHISETALDADTVWDKVVDNQKDDIGNLQRQIKEFVTENKHLIKN